MTTAIQAVEEMIDRPWTAAASQGVRPVLGVTEAAVDLVGGGRSPLMVMGGTKLGAGAPHDAIGNAGFDLTADGTPVVGACADGPSTRHGGTPPDRERSKSSKKVEGPDRHGLPSRGTGRPALASKTSRTGTVPAQFPTTVALVHSESTLHSAIASAGRRGTFKAKAVRREAKPALSWVWVPGMLLAASALTCAQASLVRRRYGNLAPGVLEVDVTVAPTRRSSGGLLPVELAAFGDSAMAGVGVEHAADSLPVQLAQRVADGLARRVHVVGYGRSGARTADVLAAQVPLARGGPDVSVLLVGTNDVTHVTPLRRLARESDALFDALLKLGGPVVMSGLPEFRALRAVPHPLREAAIAYGAVVRGVQRRRALVRTGVHLVDVRGAVGAEFVREPATMSVDSFHPSAAGYARIADAMAPTVIAVLTARPTHQEEKS